MYDKKKDEKKKKKRNEVIKKKKSIGESSAGEHQSVHPIRRQTASSLLQVVVQES